MIYLMSKKQKNKERSDNCLGRADQILSENEETQKIEQTDAGPRKKKSMLMSKKQKRKEKRGENCLGRADQILSENEETQKTEQTDSGPRKKRNKGMSKKQRKKEKSGDDCVGAADQVVCKNEGTRSNLISDGSVDDIKHNKRIRAENGSRMVDDVEPLVRKNGMNKSKGGQKAKNKNHRKQQKEKNNELEEDEVYEISSGDEDCSKGMKKWLTEYHQNRPGLKVLQQRIDEFIVAHEAQEEKARKEREALAAEGGWTVVAHHKGRKKTTDAESGITVGSVSQLAAVDKMGKKKNKVAPDFYSFQRREAQRHEVMMLQNKFEQDKKRIQQLRAARKFKPY